MLRRCLEEVKEATAVLDEPLAFARSLFVAGAGTCGRTSASS